MVSLVVFVCLIGIEGSVTMGGEWPCVWEEITQVTKKDVQFEKGRDSADEADGIVLLSVKDTC